MKFRRTTQHRNACDADPVLTNFEKRQEDSGRSIDEFVWRGDPNARPIQRAALLLFSALLLLGTVMSIASVILQPEEVYVRVLILVLGGVLGAIGVRLFFNALKH